MLQERASLCPEARFKANIFSKATCLEHVWKLRCSKRARLCIGTFPSQQIFQSEICCLVYPGTKLLQTDLPFGLNLQCITCIRHSKVMWSHCFRNNCTHCHMPPGSAASSDHGKTWSPATAPRLLTCWQVDALWAPALPKPGDFCFADPRKKFLRLILKRTPLPTPKNQLRIHAACVNACTVCMHVYVYQCCLHTSLH